MTRCLFTLQLLYFIAFAVFTGEAFKEAVKTQESLSNCQELLSISLADLAKIKLGRT